MVQSQRTPSLKRSNAGRRSAPNGFLAASQKKVVLRGGGGVAKSKSEPVLQEQDVSESISSLPRLSSSKGQDDLNNVRSDSIDGTRDWLAENSERLLAQTEKCLLVHRQLQDLLGGGDILKHIAHEKAAPRSRDKDQLDGQQLEASNTGHSLEQPSTASIVSTSNSIAHWVSLQQQLRTELANTNEEAQRLTDTIESVRSASAQFQEAVDVSCETELARLDAEARELEEGIAIRLHWLKQAKVDSVPGSANTSVTIPGVDTDQPAPVHYQALVAVTTQSRPSSPLRVSPSSSPQRLSRPSSPPRVVRRPISPARPLASATRSPLYPSTQTSRVASPNKANAPFAMSPKRTEATVISRRASSPVDSRRRRVASPPQSSTSATSSSHKQTSGTSSTRVPMRRLASPKSSVTAPPSQRIVTSRVPVRAPLESTPPRSSPHNSRRGASWTVSTSSPRGSNSTAPHTSSNIAAANRSGRTGSSNGRLHPGSSMVVAPFKQAVTPSPGNTPRGNSQGSKTPPVAPTHNGGVCMGSLQGSKTPPVAPTHNGGVLSARTPPVPQQNNGTNGGVLGARTPPVPQQNNGMLGPRAAATMAASATVIAAAAAAAATAAAQRTASPNTVVQSLQRLETVRCQAQSEFWAR